MTRRFLALLVIACASGCGGSQTPPPNESLADTPPQREQAIAPAPTPEPTPPSRADTDGDRIVDLCDECVNEPEIYNGEQDDDGCPDRGAVLLIEEHIRIIEHIFFARNAHQLSGREDVVQAIAATLQGNPQITMIGIVGHAAANERDAHALARRRAEAVQQRLIELGVATTRLSVFESGIANPLEPNRPNAEGNRRVSFAVMQTTEGTNATWDGTRMNELPQPTPPTTPLEFHRVPLTDETRAECRRLFGYPAL